MSLVTKESDMARVTESLNGVQNTREVVTKYTYFPTYTATTAPVYTFGIDLVRSQQSSSQKALSRVKSVRAYVLQPTTIGGTEGVETAQSFIGYGAVPAEFLESSSVRVGPVANTSNIIYPSLDPHWVQILSADLDNVFNASTLQPVIRTDRQAVAAMAIFSLDGAITTRSFQLCIEVEVAIPLGVDTSEEVTTAYDADFGTFDTFDGTTSLSVLTQYQNLQNSF